MWHSFLLLGGIHPLIKNVIGRQSLHQNIITDLPQTVKNPKRRLQCQENLGKKSNTTMTTAER